MEDTRFCPACGATNPALKPVCGQCGLPLPLGTSSEMERTLPPLPAADLSQPPSGTERTLPPFVLSSAPYAFGNDPPPPAAYPQQRFLERPQVKVVRPSNRRKFLVGILGGAAVLALGGTGFGQLMQNLRVAFHTRNYPYHIWDDLVGEDFSPDLNFMSMVKVHEMDNTDANLYIWDYQRQQMTTLAAGPSYGAPACIWSPDSGYFVYQTHKSGDNTTLELWDMRSFQRIRSYAGDDYSGFSKIHYSPDGTRLGLLVDNGNGYLFVVMDAMQLTPLFTFTPPGGTAQFAWSPDGQRVAFLLDASEESDTWSIQIWDMQARRIEMEATFQDRYAELATSEIYWSPVGEDIVVLVRGQIYLLRVADIITRYNLNTPYRDAQIAWSPNGRYLAISAWQYDSGLSSSNTCNVWDVAGRKIARSIDRGADNEAKALSWSQDGRHIIVIGSLYVQENWDWP